MPVLLGWLLQPLTTVFFSSSSHTRDKPLKLSWALRITGKCEVGMD